MQKYLPEKVKESLGICVLSPVCSNRECRHAKLHAQDTGWCKEGHCSTSRDLFGDDFLVYCVEVEEV